MALEDVEEDDDEEDMDCNDDRDEVGNFFGSTLDEDTDVAVTFSGNIWLRIPRLAYMWKRQK